MVTASSGRPKDRLKGRLAQLKCRKQARGMREDLGGHGRGQTTHRTHSGLCITQRPHTEPLRHLSSGWSRSNMPIMQFTLAASGKGALRGQNGGKEAMRRIQTREDSDAARETGTCGQVNSRCYNSLLKINYRLPQQHEISTS